MAARAGGILYNDESGTAPVRPMQAAPEHIDQSKPSRKLRRAGKVGASSADIKLERTLPVVAAGDGTR